MPTSPHAAPQAKKPGPIKRIGRGFLAAITSPEAVKHERSLGALIVTRLLLAAGASTALIELATKIIGG